MNTILTHYWPLYYSSFILSYYVLLVHSYKNQDECDKTFVYHVFNITHLYTHSYITNKSDLD